MKKSHLAVAAVSVFAGVAHAQSSVTLYGVIDEGINYNSNAGGGRLYSLTSGGLQASRWGLRGTEDLGGGMKALVVLENGFDASTGKLGQGGLMFGRQAYLGLSSKAGTVTLGRQYDSVVDYVGWLATGDQWATSMGAHPGDIDNFNNTYRTNNTIKYTSANYAGLSFGGTYSLGGVAGDVTSNQIWSLGAGYINGPLTLGVGYLNARTPGANSGSMFGNNTSSSTASSVTSPVFSGFASANTYQVIGAGGAYTFGAATFGATYSNIRFMNLGAVAALNTKGYTGTASFNNAEINFKYQLTPALLAGAAFNYTKGSDVSERSGATNPGAKYYQTALGIDYFLSKRSDVYLAAVYQKASGTDSTGKSAVAAINTQTASTSDKQVFVRIGIRHKF
ncbi:porin [Paraburkholderia sp. Tr-20389]|uniref:porin n=1 Tax=Paraburkholderia sp. Tr-20389 TaxID=2703903 RepID=UPI00197E8A58|nr:porin [Paraburkholderia sp. Tr-20389]MBN3756284.1 porin [Paraburkholderia sp. Tr-20389]